MNVAIILAGGSGTRMGATVPKQFLNVAGRPLLSYTIDIFEKHPQIDAIEIVCHADYRDDLAAIIDQEGFSKVAWIVDGGVDFQESTLRGLRGLEADLDDDDVILIHYGASPMTDPDIVSDAIRVCCERGNASPATSIVNLTALRTTEEYSSEWLDRDMVMKLNTPQALRFGYACWLYAEAQRRGLLRKVDPHTTSLMLAMGEKIFFSRDLSSNIKITTPEDLGLFEGFLLKKAIDQGTNAK